MYGAAREKMRDRTLRRSRAQCAFPKRLLVARADHYAKRY